MQLLKNIDRIGPSNTNKGETRDGRIREEIYDNQQRNRSHEQQSWRSQQQRSPRENYRNRMERNQGQRPSGNQVTNNRQIDVAEGIIIQNNMLQQPREELLKESGEIAMRKRTNCYAAYILIGGILTTALIDTGAAVTCLSECPTLPINGVTLVGPMGGKAIRLRRQIYADVQLSNYLIQVVFLVVPKLSRPCIIGMDTRNKFHQKLRK